MSSKHACFRPLGFKSYRDNDLGDTKNTYKYNFYRKRTSLLVRVFQIVMFMQVYIQGNLLNIYVLIVSKNESKKYQLGHTGKGLLHAHKTTHTHTHSFMSKTFKGAFGKTIP